MLDATGTAVRAGEFRRWDAKMVEDVRGDGEGDGEG